MKKERPIILISNDDGYDSKGIKELIEAVNHLGDIFVVAPKGPRSGASSALTANRSIEYNLVDKTDNVTIYNCCGTPVDCVKLALNEILPATPDLLLSGINHGSNSAINVIYSGTMGAAMEGCIAKIPSVGFSLCDHDHDADFSHSKHLVRNIATKVLEEGLPIGTCLNVNIPIGKVSGVKVASQTKGKWIKEFKTVQDEDGSNRFQLTGQFSNWEEENSNTDEWALNNGYAAIVPIKIDMTDYSYIDKIKYWENGGGIS